MGKSSRKDTEALENKSKGTKKTQKSILVDEKAVDPTLAFLFASSVSLYYAISFIKTQADILCRLAR